MPVIVFEKASQVARIVAQFRERLIGFRDSFTNPKYYPPKDADPATVASYFLVMVAMDHRLSRPGKPYEATIGGERLHGADLLYRLGRIKLMEDPEFFTASRLEKVGARDVLEWLCVGSVCPPDPEVRAAILRDLGYKLRTLYASNPLKIIEEARGRLYGSPQEPGLVDLLKPFIAYNDPVDKKPMLLAKFLAGRGLFKPVDPSQLRVPVDNHVTRIALRLGIVVLEDRLQEKLVRGEEYSAWEDVLVRMSVREAWHIVSSMAGVDDFTLDDALWSMGRSFCLYGKPLCDKCPPQHPLCNNSRCVFIEVCRARQLGQYVNEHTFLDTWWY